ncbi:MAG: hypothetical protein IJI43_02885 [Bacilli bacterium]|nr:hypothetical protein [Bacilli bacterium]
MKQNNYYRDAFIFSSISLVIFLLNFIQLFSFYKKIIILDDFVFWSPLIGTLLSICSFANYRKSKYALSIMIICIAILLYILLFTGYNFV